MTEETIEETAAVTENTTDATSEESSPQPAETTAQADAAEPEWVQKRIDKLTRKRHDAERDAEQQRRDAEYWREQAQTKSEPPKEEGAPRLEDFEDYDRYSDAMVDYRVDQRVKAKFAEQDESTKVKSRQAEVAEQARTFQSRAAEFAKDHDDFEDVVRNPRFPMNDIMGETVALSENGPLVAYHLGNNLDEAARIAAMPPTQAIRELTLLEGRLTAKPQTETTGAPEPITPVDGNTEAVDNTDNLPINDWMKKRNKQVHG